MCKKEGCIKSNNKKYGGYCSSHRNEYLLYEEMIVRECFTGKSSDYLKSNILKTLNFIYPEHIWTKVKKEYL